MRPRLSPQKKRVREIMDVETVCVCAWNDDDNVCKSDTNVPANARYMYIRCSHEVGRKFKGCFSVRLIF